MTQVKHGDTHDITIAVTSDGAAVDLTGATIRVLARPTGTADTATVLAHTIIDAAAGTLTHTLTGTLAVGPWDVEVEVARDGQIATYPTAGYLRLDVAADIG